MGTPAPTPPDAAAPASPFLDVGKFIEMVKPDLITQVGNTVLGNLADTITGTATDVAAGFHAESLSQLSALGTRLTAIETDLLPKVEQAAGRVLLNVEEDPTTQRLLVAMIVGALLIAALLVLVSALLGNATANRWIGAAPIALGAAVLWVSRMGVPLPRKV